MRLTRLYTGAADAEPPLESPEPPVPHDPAQTLLILPAGYGDGPEVAAHAAMLGLKVIGASSAPGDPAAAGYEVFLQLPHVTQPGFDARLAEAIAAHGVDQVHASHFAVWHHLKAALPHLAPGVRLTLGRSNFDLQDDYRALLKRVVETAPIPAFEGSPATRPGPNPAETAGYLRAAMAIPGESYEPKLMALMEVARRAPRGDVVEIGCLFGRTAALLAMMNLRYDLGAVLCVDPWSLRSTEQGNEELRAASRDFDWDAFRRIFEVNVAPFAQGRLNYIHALSSEGAKVYPASRQIETQTFGRTVYEGRIGLLHIDGNHEYEHVLADVRDWVPLVKPGGWVVFDDYEWDWGDGPKRVVDAFLETEAARVRLSFVRGGAMFVQFAD